VKSRFAPAFLLVISSFLGSHSALADQAVYVLAGQLLDAETGNITENSVIAIEGERIASVGTDRSVVPEGATVHDLSGQFVLPGLMDMHVHVPGNLEKYYFARYFQSPHRAGPYGLAKLARSTGQPVNGGFGHRRYLGRHDCMRRRRVGTVVLGAVGRPPPGLCDYLRVVAGLFADADCAAAVLGPCWVLACAWPAVLRVGF